ncbi:related to NCL1-tRNA (cytosine-5-)-methyltransferase / probable Orotate phosphoribosyl transferase [Serendipita indica DSM 11827]|uniref:Related to NCL1-tRNA (Cytosine-5-)-methyltransferase / probable Orotate phosphoribosyl transferase n=1 Tax=Serendipita indica (strain DSM 11827) TaxID=1109443 RepID=G4TS38_SERID|nr:related to NCL1-tRNA (cytosine-5-)-methyltransferase / probable Orotate phosphoribosyl transferase [Serendipita indica DSM 11827]
MEDPKEHPSVSSERNGTQTATEPTAKTTGEAGGKRTGKDKKEKKKKKAKPQRTGEWATDIERKNASFERYYEAQNLFEDRTELDLMLDSLKRDLPTTFRVTGSRITANDVNDIIRKVHVPNLTGIQHEGVDVDPPRPIPWYLGGLAWQINVNKSVVRKLVPFQQMQRFLVYETEVGNISRQEATAQILEAMHTLPSGEPVSSPSGIIIANDSDYKRAGLLVHQSARLPSPSLVVTNVDASYYPNIYIDNQGMTLEFDRILCDVPCSGDGTMRKNAVIWRQWTIQGANGLHCLQLRILQRAMRMLAPGGRIVYSTCSLNPVENEAVVAAAIKSSAGEYQLVDVSNRLPELVRRPGITSWQVCTDKDTMNMESSFTAYWERLNDKQRADSKIVETMFPPQEVHELNLDRCWRIYPHLQNTGGFFVAVLERSPTYVLPPPKKKHTKRPVDDLANDSEQDGERTRKRARVDTNVEVTLDTEMADPTPVDTEPGPVEKEKKEKGKGTYKEDPYTYVDANSELVTYLLKCLQVQDTITNARGETEAFPRHNLFVRNADATTLRSVYLSNDRVKAVLTSNEPSRLRFISAGVKLAVRQDAGARKAMAQGGPDAETAQKYRVLHDSVSQVLPFMRPEDVIHGDTRLLKVFVERMYPLAREFASPYGEVLGRCELGHHVLQIDPSSADSEVLKGGECAYVIEVWITLTVGQVDAPTDIPHLEVERVAQSDAR